MKESNVGSISFFLGYVYSEDTDAVRASTTVISFEKKLCLQITRGEAM